MPVAEVARFDWVVVEPEHVDARDLERLDRAGARVFAYLSLGEAAPASVEPSWILGRNAAWGSAIVDPRAPGWRAKVIAHVDALRKRGFRGLFLDTLDSYAIVVDGAERRAAAAAMASLIRTIGDRHRDVRLFFNRGFELIGEVGTYASAVAAESLLFGWDAAGKRYVEVPAPERAWLTAKLREVQQQLRVPIVVIDYLPDTRREEARAAARRIEDLGFVPWIATPALDTIGVGAAASSERVLLVHDGAEPPSPVGELIAERVQALGCAVDRVDVRSGLPSETGHTHIVTWFTDDELPEITGYPRWLARQLDAGARVAVLGRPGFVPGAALLRRLGLAAVPAGRAVRVVRRDGLVGETPPRSRGLVPWQATAPEVTVHLRIADAAGRAIDPVVTAPWGGLALQPYLVELGYEGRARWIVDPTAFLRRALGIVRCATGGGRS